MRNIVTISALLLAAPSVQAAPLFFDDFNANTVGLNVSPIGWSVSDGTVDIVGPVNFPEICAIGGDRCIDLDGSSNNAGRMTSAASFVLTLGVTYTLSFDYSWNYFNQINPNTMTFGVGAFSSSLTTSGIRTTAPQPYAPLSFSFVGDGSSGSIFFDHEGGDNGGIVIDNVAFEGGSGQFPAVPLPAGLPLMMAGLAAFGLTARRKHKG